MTWPVIIPALSPARKRIASAMSSGRISLPMGISGITAQKIGELLKKLAETRQLLVITHLPQIAAAGQAAYRIDKEVSQEKTHTTIRALDEEGRVQEIARLLGGDHITEAILQSARELLGSEAK